MIAKILLATDGSPSAADAAALAAEIASCTGATVTVLSVVQPTPLIDFAPVYPGMVDESVNLAHSEVERQVEKLRKAGVKAEAVVEISPSVDGTIVDIAESLHADLIVMGTHGHSALARAILGSTADRVLRGTRTPLLFARHEEQA